MSVGSFIGALFNTWIPAVLVALSQGNSAISAPFNAVTSPAAAQNAASYLKSFPVAGYEHFFYYWQRFAAISLVASLILLTILFYSVARLLQVRAFERKRFASFSHTVASQDVSRTQLRWSRIREQIQSDDPQSWRLAILEADIMLNELLESRGLRGETMADKMRAAERSNFNTIDMAWEAHRVRNRIAHEGERTDISQHEARRVINLYETVFREFGFVD